MLKGEGSSLDEVNFFNLPNPSSRTMALGSTQPLTEMSTRNLSGGQGRPVRKSGQPSLNRLSRCGTQPHGPSLPVTEIALPFYLVTANLWVPT
jgi:hypothetical protein